MIVAAAAVMGLTQTSLAADSSTSNTASSTTTHLNNGHRKIGFGVINKLMGKKGTDNAANMATIKADRLKKQQAVTAALDASDYNAWVTAVGTSSPMVTKITASNFPQYVQAYQLRKQADLIMTGLGLGKGQENGFMGPLGK